MNLSLKAGGLLAAAVLGATALGLAVLLARDPALLKRLVRQGAIAYSRALTVLAEAREQLGDSFAEALQEAEDELRQRRTTAAPEEAATARDAAP